jgi:hypothetical protein
MVAIKINKPMLKRYSNDVTFDMIRTRSVFFSFSSAIMPEVDTRGVNTQCMVAKIETKNVAISLLTVPVRITPITGKTTYSTST